MRIYYLQGAVELSLVVLANGGVGEVTVTKSLDVTYGLDDSAVTAARQWRLKPGQKNGQPVDVRVTVLMRFALK